MQARDYDNKPVAARAHVELLALESPRRSETDVKAATDVDTGAGRLRHRHARFAARRAIPTACASPPARPKAATSRTTPTCGFPAAALEFERGDDTTLPLVPDKKQYRAGDTAHLLIVTGKPNTPVYVTVEGRDLREWRLIRSPDTTAAFDVPVIRAGRARHDGKRRASSATGTYYYGIKYMQRSAGRASAERESRHR